MGDLRADLVNFFYHNPTVGKTVIGRQISKDPKLITDILGGRQARPETEEKIRKWLEDYQDGNIKVRAMAGKKKIPPGGITIKRKVQPKTHAATRYRTKANQTFSHIGPDMNITHKLIGAKAHKVWCEQEDKLVSKSEVEKCTSKFCKLRNL